LIRNHGDLHLGQVLWAGGDWVVVDFEGEPARPLSERRRKRSPLRDVAGMLRSFAYAASVTGGAEDGADEFEERARAAFLSGYYGAVQPAGILPRSLDETERLIRIFELEKAVYELRYELAHRPDWVEVPVAGIVRLLERTPV
jgi:maltokinase